MQLRLLASMGLTALSVPCLLVACSDSETTSSGSPASTTGSGGQSTSTGQGGSAQGGQGGSGQGGQAQGGNAQGGNAQGGNAQGGQAQGGSGQGGSQGEQQCWSKPDPNQPCPDLSQAPSYWSCTMDGNKSVISFVSGPTEMNGMCCYEVITEDGCVVIGRPFFVDDVPLTAALCHARSSWSRRAARPRIDALSPEERAALAAAWAKDALYEHASVASFARFALALLAHGAPAELVQQAHEAASDEVRHARLCFALASAYAGEPLGPGRLPVPDALAMPRSLRELAVSTAIEGCIGETIAAMVAAEQHARATDPAVREVLASIAADEARHAELAWRTVAWALERGEPGLHAAIAGVFRGAAAHLPAFEPAADERLVAHGRLGEESLRRIKRQVLDEVVLPCAAALLRERAPSDRALRV